MLSEVYVVGSRKVPSIQLAEGFVFHTFISHVWSSAQDQAAVIKRQMVLLLPGIRVFLDVDDLDELSKLEEYIAQTSVVCLFISRGYFLSRNCMREVAACADQRKPAVLIH